MTMNKTAIKITIASLTIAIAFGIIAYAVKARQGFRTPMKVFPYYCSANPYSANVGGFSETLLYANVERLRGLSHTIKECPDNYPIEVMFILAVRLWDENEKELAMYWHYCASFRTDVLALCRTNESSKGDYKIAPLLNFKREMERAVRRNKEHGKEERVAAIKRARKDCQGMVVNDSLYPTLARRKGMTDSLAIALTDAQFCQMAAHAAYRAR